VEGGGREGGREGGKRKIIKWKNDEF